MVNNFSVFARFILQYKCLVPATHFRINLAVLLSFSTHFLPSGLSEVCNDLIAKKFNGVIPAMIHIASSDSSLTLGAIAWYAKLTPLKLTTLTFFPAVGSEDGLRLFYRQVQFNLYDMNIVPRTQSFSQLQPSLLNQLM